MSSRPGSRRPPPLQRRPLLASARRRVAGFARLRLRGARGPPGHEHCDHRRPSTATSERRPQSATLAFDFGDGSIGPSNSGSSRPERWRHERLPLDGLRGLVCPGVPRRAASARSSTSATAASAASSRLGAEPRQRRSPAASTLVSEEFASMLALALDAARATGGLVTPAVGGACSPPATTATSPLARSTASAVEPVAAVPSLESLSLRGRMLLRTDARRARPERRRQGQDRRRRARAAGRGWVSAGGDLATTVPVVVGLPGGGAITALRRRARHEQHRRAQLAARRRAPAPPDRPGDRAPGAHPVARRHRRRRQPASRPTLPRRPPSSSGAAGPSWLDRRGLAGRFVDTRGVVDVNESWRAALPRRLAA